MSVVYYGIPANGGYDGLVRRRNGFAIELLRKSTGEWVERGDLIKAVAEGEFDRISVEQAAELARSFGWPLDT